MSISERRREVRLHLEIPLQFRSTLQPFAPMRVAKTLNMSPKGLYFTTEHPLQVGSSAELTFNNPKELTGIDPTPVRCTGRVMHVTPVRNSAFSGIGMRIEKVEPMLSHANPGSGKARAGVSNVNFAANGST
jgi:hypothetical protein